MTSKTIIVKCDICDCEYKKAYEKRHLKTKKHIFALKSLEILKNKFILTFD